MKPLISVLMCFRNENSNLLKDAVDSILSQTYTNFELILIDDASTQSYVFLNDYKDRNPQIKYYKNESNLGLTKSLNKALSFASGQYIARLDSDDISFPQRFEIQAQFLEKNQDYVLVASRFLVISQGKEYEPAESMELDVEDIRKMISAQNFAAHSTILMRADKLRSIDGYDEFYMYAQDYDLYLRMLSLGKIKVLNDILVKRNLLEGAISFKKRREQRFYALLIMVRGFIRYGGGVAFFKNLIKGLFVILMPSRVTEFIKSLSYFNFQR